MTLEQLELKIEQKRTEILEAERDMLFFQRRAKEALNDESDCYKRKVALELEMVNLKRQYNKL